MSLGPLNNGKNRLANPISNGRQRPSSPNDVRGFSKHSNSLLGRPITQEEATMEGTTTGGIGTTDAPHPKEDTTWTSILQSPRTSTPLPVDSNIPKQRKRNSCETTHASIARSQDIEPVTVERNKLTAVNPAVTSKPFEQALYPSCQTSKIQTASLDS